ncbi:hypothetical protein LZ30DRAFT_671786 [Colletotrichum cereale]|nr:hypothetical protein LZ30DRAFT_671786 [Colletotrichum cereale]
MRNFPIEILLLIFDNLRSSDLSRTARCSRLYHALATPKLYESLRIRMKSRLTHQQVPKLLSTLMQPRVERLSLAFINVALFDPKNAPSLRSLDLRYCPGAEVFCRRLAAAIPPDLTDVRIAAHAESGTPNNFTAWLGSARNVEHVALCIGGLSETIPFEQVKGHRSTLRTLVLDPRRNVLDPSSVLKYSPADLREIVEQCASLRTLGLPLDLRDYQCHHRYTRSHQIKRIIPSCALETLHLRGRDHSPQRSRVDAKHLARRFLLRQYSVRVLIGHGRGMNAFTTTDGRTIVSTRLSRREQFQPAVLSKQSKQIRPHI